MVLDKRGMSDAFDEAYYLRRNPDVARGVWYGHFQNGEQHFLRHGEHEGRSRRTRAAVDPDVCFAVSVCPAKDYFSGVTLALASVPVGGDITVLVESSSGPERRTSAIAAQSIDDYQFFTAYWNPIESAKDRSFKISVHHSGAGTEALGFVLAGNDQALVHSPPETDSAFPPALLVSPVTQCNLNCIHCISAHSRTRFSRLDDADWAQIEAAVAAGHLHYIRADYSGDILFAHSKHGGWLDRIIALDVAFGIDTHGNNLDEAIARKLLASRLNDVNFSVDSLDPQDYPRIRRGARPLPEVLSNICMFARLRDEFRPDLAISMSYVLMRRNLDAIPAAIEFAASIGIRFQGHHLHAWKPELVEESLLLDRERYAARYFEFVKLARERGVDFSIPPPVAPVAPRRGHLPCPIPWTSAVVLGNGDVMACCVPGTKVGSLRESSLQEVWNGESMRAFRAAVNSDVPPQSCANCPIWRMPNDFSSYAPVLEGEESARFVQRCVEAFPAARENGHADAASACPTAQPGRTGLG